VVDNSEREEIVNIVKSVECDGDSVTGDSMIECFLHSIGACGIMFYLRCS